MKLNMWMKWLPEMLREVPGEAGGASAGGDTPPAGGGDDTPPSGGGNDTPPATDLSFIPETYMTDGVADGKAFRESYDGLVELKAQHDARMAAVPESGDGYAFDMPEDLDFGELNLPDDFTVDSLAEDEAMKPLLSQFGAFLHRIGAPTEASSEAMGMLATYEATKYAKLYSETKAEFGKIKDADSRLSTVKTVLEKRLDPEEAASLAPNTAAQLKATEKLLSLGGPLTVPPEPGGGDDENLSPLERLKRARGG